MGQNYQMLAKIIENKGFNLTNLEKHVLFRPLKMKYTVYNQSDDLIMGLILSPLAIFVLTLIVLIDIKM